MDFLKLYLMSFRLNLIKLIIFAVKSQKLRTSSATEVSFYFLTAELFV